MAKSKGPTLTEAQEAEILAAHPHLLAKHLEMKRMTARTQELLALPQRLRELEPIAQKVNGGVRTIEEIRANPNAQGDANALMREVCLKGAQIFGHRTLPIAAKLCEVAEELAHLTEDDAQLFNEVVTPIIPHDGWSPVSGDDFRRMWIVVHELQKTLLGFRDWEANTRAHRAIERLDLDPTAKRLRQGPALTACDAAILAWHECGDAEPARLSICRALTVRLKELDQAEFINLTPHLVRDAFRKAQGRAKQLRRNLSRPKLLLLICSTVDAWPDASIQSLEKK